MARRRIGRRLRRQVRERARHRGEYCQHPDLYASGSFACEHVVPRIRGAGDTFNELAWSCAGCNSHKYDKIKAVDPSTGRLAPLFNPRRQNWSTHFEWSADGLLILGQTATGRATSVALQLNRPELVNLRYALRMLGEHPP